MWGVGSWQESCQRLGTTTEHETQCPVTIYSGTNVTLLIWGNAILIRRCGFDSPTSREMLDFSLSHLLHFSVVLVLSRYWNGPFSHTQKELVQGKLMSYLVEEMRGCSMRRIRIPSRRVLSGDQERIMGFCLFVFVFLPKLGDPGSADLLGFHPLSAHSCCPVS